MDPAHDRGRGWDTTPKSFYHYQINYRRDCAQILSERALSLNGMDEDIVNPVPPAEGEEGDDKEIDPDMLEDTFDDVDPL